MPIYEYKCQQCGLVIEKRQNVSDDPLTTCEKCHGRLEKQWSLSGFQFKGAGWYVTDYSGKKSSDDGHKSEKNSGGESTGKADTASKSTGDGSKTTKTDTSSKKD